MKQIQLGLGQYKMKWKSSKMNKNKLEVKVYMTKDRQLSNISKAKNQ